MTGIARAVGKVVAIAWASIGIPGPYLYWSRSAGVRRWAKVAWVVLGTTLVATTARDGRASSAFVIALFVASVVAAMVVNDVLLARRDTAEVDRRHETRRRTREANEVEWIPRVDPS